MDTFEKRLIYLYGEWKEVDKYRLVNLFKKTTHMLKRYWTGAHLPSTEVVLAIKHDIPNLNLNWFFTGEGEPFLDSSKPNELQQSINNADNKEKEDLKQKLAILEEQVSSIVTGFNEVKELAYSSLEKLKGVALVRLFSFCEQFVNTPKLLICN